MNIADYTDRKDRFGRKFPIKLTLTTGEILYGHSVANKSFGGNTNSVLFGIIDNLSDWTTNKIDKGNQTRMIQGSEIVQMDNFTDY